MCGFYSDLQSAVFTSCARYRTVIVWDSWMGCRPFPCCCKSTCAALGSAGGKSNPDCCYLIVPRVALLCSSLTLTFILERTQSHQTPFLRSPQSLLTFRKTWALPARLSWRSSATHTTATTMVSQASVTTMLKKWCTAAGGKQLGAVLMQPTVLGSRTLQQVCMHPMTVYAACVAQPLTVPCITSC